MKPTHAVFASTLLLSILLSVNAAHACTWRPGTPTNLVATVVGDKITLQFTNTASGGAAYWDIDVRDGANNYLGHQTGRSHATDRNGEPAIAGHGENVVYYYSNPNLRPGSTVCFRVRARSNEGDTGCVSENWGNQSCVTIPDPERHAFCQQYARDAGDQISNLDGLYLPSTLHPQCSGQGPFWRAPFQDHYNWCLAMRAQPHSASFPDQHRATRQRVVADCTALASRLRAPPKPPARPPAAPPPPPVCAVNALVTVDQCYNADGTPSDAYAPGTTQQVGCGTSEDEAIKVAQISIGIQFSDEPEPNSCTFTKQTWGGLCACSPLRNAISREFGRSLRSTGLRVPKASCAGDMRHNESGRCACPADTSQRGIRCVADARGGGQQGQAPGGGGAAPEGAGPGGGGTQQASSGGGLDPNAGLCPPGQWGTPPDCKKGSGGINMVYPNECPAGSSGTPPFCQQTASAPPAQSVTQCPPGTFGTPPFCQTGSGGINKAYPNECPAGSSGTPPFCQQTASAPAQQDEQCPPGTTGTPPFCQKGAGGAYPSRPGPVSSGGSPAGTGRGGINKAYPQYDCPPGYFGSPPNCRSFARPKVGSMGNPKRDVDRRCPAGSYGRYPNCRRFGSMGGEQTKQVDRRCPAGTFGRYPRCRSSTSMMGTTNMRGTPKKQTKTQHDKKVRPPRRARCPAGTVGRPPRCFRTGSSKRPSMGGINKTKPAPRPSGLPK